MSVLALNKVEQKYLFTSEIEVKKALRDFTGHFTRYDLELRELETQAKEFQKLAAKLFSEGHFSTSKEILRRKENVVTRMGELQGILTNVNLSMN
ncbi:MAG: hypothetical protein ACTSVO_11680 [Candidatus Heimdallarchaeaceae archaeon]